VDSFVTFHAKHAAFRPEVAERGAPARQWAFMGEMKKNTLPYVFFGCQSNNREEGKFRRMLKEQVLIT
jgi:hypothetical protein